MKISNRTIVAIAISLAVVLFVAAFLTSCNSEKRAMHKIDLLDLNHPTAVATKCMELYPSRITKIKRDTSFLKGDSVMVSIIVPCPDKLQPKNIHDTVKGIQYVRIPYKIAQPKEIVRDSFFYEDSAKVTLMRIALNIEKAKSLKETDEKVSWRKWCLIFGGVILLYAVLLLLKLGGKLAIKLPI